VAEAEITGKPKSQMPLNEKVIPKS